MKRFRIACLLYLILVVGHAKRDDYRRKLKSDKTLAPTSAPVPASSSTFNLVVSSPTFDASAISSNADAQDLLVQGLTHGLNRSKSNKTPKFRNKKKRNLQVESFTEAAPTFPDSQDVEAETYSDISIELPSDDPDQTQAIIDLIASDGTLTSIYSELDVSGTYSFTAYAFPFGAVYEVRITVEFPCDVTGSIDDELARLALTDYHVRISALASQSFTNVNVVNVAITDGECVITRRHQRGLLRGLQVSLIQYNLFVYCTGTCPEEAIPPVDTVNRRQLSAVTPLNDDVFRFDILQDSFSNIANVNVTDAKTNQEDNVALTCNDRNDCPTLCPTIVDGTSCTDWCRNYDNLGDYHQNNPETCLARDEFNFAPSSCASNTACVCGIASRYSLTYNVVTNNTDRICDAHNLNNVCPTGGCGNPAAGCEDDSACSVMSITITGRAENCGTRCICEAEATNSPVGKIDVYSSDCIDHNWDTSGVRLSSNTEDIDNWVSESIPC